MKTIIKIFIFNLLFIAPCLSQDDSLPKTTKIYGQEVVLKENKGNDKGFIAEYIPKNETFDNWTFMFAVRFIAGKDATPLATAQQTASNINKRKEGGDPYANSVILQSNDKSKIAVDFLISDKNIYEHNIWTYIKTKNGLLAYQIARRDYSENPEKTKKFIMGIQSQRGDLLKEITRADLPKTKFN